MRRIWASRLVAIRPVKNVQPVAAFASVGQLCMRCWESPPEGWLPCDGRAVSRQEYQQLFEVIKTVYGNDDDQTTFRVPDLQGRFALGKGTGSECEFLLGAKGGKAQHVLLESEMPRHSHGIHDPGHAHSVEAGGRKFTANGGKGSAFGVTLLGNLGNPEEGCGTGSSQVAHSHVSVHEAGAGAPHNNMPPYVVVCHISSSFEGHPLERLKLVLLSV